MSFSSSLDKLFKRKGEKSDVNPDLAGELTEQDPQAGDAMADS